MKSTLQHSFSQVPKVERPRSTFNRSHGLKTTLDEGYLVPFFVDEVLPGDTLHLRTTMFGRIATPIKPIMDNIFLDTFYFFVPNRLLWDNWQKFMGEQINPGDSTSFLVPTCTSPAGGYLEHSLHDYMGLPTKVAGIVHNNLYLRAYNEIYNAWFRDENLQNSVYHTGGDGPDSHTNFTLLKRGKRHDYFTSALPWPQKGPSVSIPLGTTAPVRSDGNVSYFRGIGASANTSLTLPTAAGDVLRTGSAQSVSGALTFGPAGTSTSGLYTDLTTATAATINQLRQAFQVQRLYERDARGGTRYIEILQSHFGVTSPDSRLQRPEYLGGGSSMININPIAKTSSTDVTSPQGNLSAMGTVHSSGTGFHQSFVEHGVVIGLVSIRADMTYQQGLNKIWQRSTRLDYYFPVLAHLGEQAVLNNEIYAQGTAVDSQVFGYQERYAEYRYKPSQITGKFRSNATGTLDIWHLAQNFSSLPALNATFIQEAPPISRILAVPSEPHFLLDCYMSYKSARCMPVYGVPGLIDHF